MSTIHSIVITGDLAEGKSQNRPYDFEIERSLEELGFRSNVLDYYPSKVGSGFDWIAKIWKYHPQVVSNDAYRKMTNCSGSDNWNVRFKLEEMQEVLIAHGYEIIIHIAKGNITETESIAGTGEVRKTGRRWVENVERILAIKPEDKTNLPEWNDSGRAYYLSFEATFNRLMKQKLSNPSDLFALEKRIADLERNIKAQKEEEWTRRVEESERG